MILEGERRMTKQFLLLAFCSMIALSTLSISQPKPHNSSRDVETDVVTKVHNPNSDITDLSRELFTIQPPLSEPPPIVRPTVSRRKLPTVSLKSGGGPPHDLHLAHGHHDGCETKSQPDVLCEDKVKVPDQPIPLHQMKIPSHQKDARVPR